MSLLEFCQFTLLLLYLSLSDQNYVLSVSALNFVTIYIFDDAIFQTVALRFAFPFQY